MSAYLLRTSGPLVGLARSQTLSPARLIFLISLVVFFTVLFIVSYVWMRKPQFGQHQGHVQPGASGKPPIPKGSPVSTPSPVARTWWCRGFTRLTGPVRASRDLAEAGAARARLLPHRRPPRRPRKGVSSCSCPVDSIPH